MNTKGTGNLNRTVKITLKFNVRNLVEEVVKDEESINIITASITDFGVEMLAKRRVGVNYLPTKKVIELRLDDGDFTEKSSWTIPEERQAEYKAVWVELCKSIKYEHTT